jgi:hypothetical protein
VNFVQINDFLSIQSKGISLHRYNILISVLHNFSFFVFAGFIVYFGFDNAIQIKLFTNHLYILLDTEFDLFMSIFKQAYVSTAILCKM